jgi:hypothetical protein
MKAILKILKWEKSYENIIIPVVKFGIEQYLMDET